MRVGYVLTLVTLLGIEIMMPGCGGAVPSQSVPHEVLQKQSERMAPPISQQDLVINTVPEKYTYEDFIGDLHKLQDNCSDNLQCVKLCDTSDGREVYDIVLGDPSSANHVLIFAAMHAREYITTQVVMRQLCDALDVLNGYDDSTYRGYSKKSLLRNVTVHFVPLDNPDGVAISQFGLNGVQNDDLRHNIASMAGGDYEQWKANAVGVDLNRNFDAGWQEFGGSPYSAAERYKGVYPGSEPEAACLIQLTKQNHIRRAISYHTCGALIYWYYKQTGAVLEESRHFAGLVSEETGYPLDDDYTAVDAAGYKDWAVYKMGVPAITIEVGAENGRSLINPVPMGRFGNIWERNKNVVYAVAYSLQ